MAPVLDPTDFQTDAELQTGSERDVSRPDAQPERLPSPLSAALPRTVAGRQRAQAAPVAWPRRTLRPDWTALGVGGLMLASAALSVYRLFWAIH